MCSQLLRGWRGEWWSVRALQLRLLAAASVKRQLFSSLSKRPELKIALVSVYEATGRFLQREGTVDVLCNGAGCVHSASSPSPKCIYLKILIHVFWGMWWSIICLNDSPIWGSGMALQGRWFIGGKRGLLCSCGKINSWV